MPRAEGDSRRAEASLGIARLRALTSTPDLIEQVCEEVVRSCGFGRVVLSRVHGRSWRPWRAYSTDGADLASWFGEWTDVSIDLVDSIPEGRVLLDHRAAIVYDTDRVSVHRPIIVDAGHSRSYVVTAVLQAETVIGFLHADHFPSQRQVDESDLDVLWAFGVAFGYLYERTVLLEQFRVQSSRALELLAAATREIDGSDEPTVHSGWDGWAVGSDRPPPGRPSTAEPLAGAFGTLTQREGEVFRLLAAGATNAAIAATLVISGDTVKSHVKQILRKLGAANRSQAIVLAAGQTANSASQ